MKFLREFEIGSADLDAPGLHLGRGSHVVIGAPVVKQKPRGDFGARDTEIEVTFPINVTFTCGIARGLKHSHCAVCNATPPLPDDEALVFLLHNSDGNRLAFPAHEDCEEERDCYPVTGWRLHHDEDGEDGLICPDCHAELAAAKAAIKKRRAK